MVRVGVVARVLRPGRQAGTGRQHARGGGGRGTQEIAPPGVLGGGFGGDFGFGRAIPLVVIHEHAPLLDR
jgi:hypothetical protein